MTSTMIYPTDLTDEQWVMIQEILPKPKSGPGRPGRPTVDLRNVINGILYLNKTGCQWRIIPKEYGNWNTIYWYSKKWREQKVWDRIMQVLN